MIDIFSPEFLQQLRKDAKPKSKASKAVLEAVKDLTQKNQSSKKKIMGLESEVANLRQENAMLLEIMEASKSDFEERMKGKQKKLENCIEVEASLRAENESLKKEVENLSTEINLIKQLAQEHIQIPSKHSLTDRSISEKVSFYEKGSSCDLAAYLFTARGRTEHSIEEMSKEHSSDYVQELESKANLEELRESRKSRTGDTMWRSQQIEYRSEEEIKRAVDKLVESNDREGSQL